MNAQHTPGPATQTSWEARRWCHGDNSYTKWQPCSEAQMHAWSLGNGGFEFRRVAIAKTTKDTQP